MGNPSGCRADPSHSSLVGGPSPIAADPAVLHEFAVLVEPHLVRGEQARRVRNPRQLKNVHDDTPAVFLTPHRRYALRGMTDQTFQTPAGSTRGISRSTQGRCAASTCRRGFPGARPTLFCHGSKSGENPVRRTLSGPVERSCPARCHLPGRRFEHRRDADDRPDHSQPCLVESRSSYRVTPTAPDHSVVRQRGRPEMLRSAPFACVPRQAPRAASELIRCAWVSRPGSGVLRRLPRLVRWRSPDRRRGPRTRIS